MLSEEIATRESAAFKWFVLAVYSILRNQAANALTLIRLWLAIEIFKLLWMNPKSPGLFENPATWWDARSDGINMFCYYLPASLTDWLDGKVARKLGIVSNFGILSDKIVDKILNVPIYAFMLLCFLWLFHISDWSQPAAFLVFFQVATNIVIFFFGALLAFTGIRINTSAEGKNKMKWECVTVNYWILFALVAGVKMNNILLLISTTILLIFPAYYCYLSVRGYMIDAIRAWQARA